MKTETRTFHATVNEESIHKVKRAKLPSGLIVMLGANKGDVIEFEVTGRQITGGRVLTGKAATEAKAQALNQSRFVREQHRPKPAAKQAQGGAKKAGAKKAAKKGGAKKAGARKGGAIPKPGAAKKGGGRKGRTTAVAYDTPSEA